MLLVTAATPVSRITEVDKSSPISTLLAKSASMLNQKCSYDVALQGMAETERNGIDGLDSNELNGTGVSTDVGTGDEFASVNTSNPAEVLIVNSMLDKQDSVIELVDVEAVVSPISGAKMTDQNVHKRQQAKVIPRPTSWVSMFDSLPRIAGDYSPLQFDIAESPMELPELVMQAAYEFWSDSLVGFFPSPTPVEIDVHEHVCRVWKISGGLRVNYVDDMFYLKFNKPEERRRVLECKPSILAGMPFIITSWCTSVDTAREQVFTIPVWARFTHVPSVLQSLLGLNWLACHIGKLMCFDANTVARKKLSYANALIEITPGKQLPSVIEVIIEGRTVVIDVCYSWKPDICTGCHSFGHTGKNCKFSVVGNSLPLPEKIPLPRPPLSKWVRKEPQPIPLPKPPAPVHVDPTEPSPQLLVPEVESTCIVWNTEETAWIHTSSDMRYKPERGDFFMFVTEEEGEHRMLHYYDFDGDLVLYEEGEFGSRNKAVLEDVSWIESSVMTKTTLVMIPTWSPISQPLGRLPIQLLLDFTVIALLKEENDRFMLSSVI